MAFAYFQILSIRRKFSTMPRILLETCVIKLIVGESAEVKTEPVRINANIAMGARTPRTEAGTAPATSSAQRLNAKAENHRPESISAEASQSGTPNEEPQAKKCLREAGSVSSKCQCGESAGCRGTTASIRTEI